MGPSLVDNNVCILPHPTSTTPCATTRVPSHYTGAAVALGSDSRRGTSRVGESMGQAPTSLGESPFTACRAPREAMRAIGGGWEEPELYHRETHQ